MSKKKRKVIIGIIIIIIIILALLTSCGITAKVLGKIGSYFQNGSKYEIDDDDNDYEVIRNKNLKLDLSDLEISETDEAGKISFTLTDILPKEVVCTTSDANIATCYVENNYVNIIPKGVGKITLTLSAKANGKMYEATSNITILPGQREIVIVDSKKTINLAQNNILKVPYSLKNLTGNLKVTSSNEQVASVQVVGNDIVVTAKSTGKVTIKLTVDYNGKTYEKEFVVNVVDKTTTKSTNSLTSITSSVGKISPEFNKNNTYYSLLLSSSTDKISLYTKVSNKKDKVTFYYNDKEYKEFKDIPLNYGSNIVKVVLNSNGTKYQYIINIFRDYKKEQPVVNSYLKDIVLSSGVINFDSNVYEYDVNLNDIKLSVNGVPSDVKSTVTYLYDNKELNSFQDIKLSDGLNVVRIIVRNASSASVYTLNVNVMSKDSNNSLSSLILNVNGSKKDIIDSSKDSFEETVNKNVANVSLIATPSSSKAQVKYYYGGKYYTEFENIEINDGDNIVFVLVTAEDDTTKTYIVNVKRYYVETLSEYTTSITKTEKYKDIIINTNIFNDLDTNYDGNTKTLTIYEKSDTSKYIILNTNSNLITNIEYLKGIESIAIRVWYNDQGKAQININGSANGVSLINDKITLNIVLKYVISFDPNGGKFGELNTDNIEVFKIGPGEKLDLTTVSKSYFELEKKCLYYDFVGYSLSKDSNEIYDKNVINYEELDGDLTLYAVYNKNEEKKYTTITKNAWISDVEIFKDEKQENNIEKLISPSSYGKYTIEVNNNTKGDITITDIMLKEDTICIGSEGCINMSYIIKDSNNYTHYNAILNSNAYTKDWQNNHNETNVYLDNKIVIPKKKSVEVTLHWKWESVNDHLDTLIGSFVANDGANDKYTLYFGFKYDYMRNDCD